MLYSAYFGGNKTSRGQSIAVEANGNAYITGFTVSSNFPVSSPTHPYQSTKADMF